MRKKLLICLLFSLVLAIGLFASCNDNKDETILDFDAVYVIAKEAGYTGTLEELIVAFKGDSAYQIAVKNGYSGSESEWLNTLVGAAGLKGDDGQTGEKGQKGDNGKDGNNGKDGKDGITPHIGENGNWFIGTTDTGVIADNKRSFVVKLDFDNNEFPKNVSVLSGTTLELPLLQKDGYVFLGWYTGLNANDKKFTNYDGVFRDMTLYARFEEITDLYFTEGLKFTFKEPYQSYSVGLPTNTMISSRATFNEIIIPKLYNDGINGLKPVIQIEMNAFKNCSNLTNIILPDTIKEIHQFAFSNAAKLHSITIPASAGYVAFDAFDGCNSLTSINIEEENINLKSVDGVAYSKDGTILKKYPPAKSSTQYIVPTSVKTLPKNAFTHCKNLVSITLPDGIESILSSTFSNSTKLVTINLPTSITSIQDNAFSNCTSLTTVNLPVGLTKLGHSAFLNCESLTQINLPTNIISLERETFSNCKSLTSINLDKVKTIATSVFKDCKMLDNLQLSNELTKIEFATFKGCENLKNIILPANLLKIEQDAFGSCINLITLTIPNKVNYIGGEAFANCSNFKSIIIPISVTTIEYQAFDNCILLSINAQAQTLPITWHAKWNVDNLPVTWGYND